LTETRKAPLFQIALALAAVYVIWGSTYLAMAMAIETIPPFFMAGARYLTAGAILYAWARKSGAPRPARISRRAPAPREEKQQEIEREEGEAGTAPALRRAV
jgi:drug/metabolite transporter (DMT)-like permease